MIENRDNLNAGIKSSSSWVCADVMPGSHTTGTDQVWPKSSVLGLRTRYHHGPFFRSPILDASWRSPCSITKSWAASWAAAGGVLQIARAQMLNLLRYKRRKDGKNHPKDQCPCIEVVLNLEVIRPYFMSPIKDAAIALDVCVTALKR